MKAVHFSWALTRWMSPMLQVRVAILTAATSTIALWLWAPSSMTAEIEALAASARIQWVFVLVVLVGWLDVLVNDVLPARIQLLYVLHRRHLLYSLLGALYLLKSFAAVSSLEQGSLVLVCSYLAMAFGCAWYTFTAASRVEE